MTSNDTRSSLGHGSYDRKLRYRVLLEDLSTLEDESGNNVERMERTASAVHQAQALLAEGGLEERVRHPGEGYLDSRVLRATSDLAVRCSEAVTGNAHTYDWRELAQHIREVPDFWECVFPLELPSMGYLFGTFSATPPEQRPRAARRRVERQKAAALKAPEAVDRVEKTEQGSELVSRAHRFLCKAQRASGRALSYFHAVLDPHSFARTVENVYLVSFLVRDGLVAINLDEEHGLPFISPRAAADQERNVSGENQFIVSIDMQRWQELKEAFDIKKPMMVLKRL